MREDRDTEPKSAPTDSARREERTHAAEAAPAPPPRGSRRRLAIAGLGLLGAADSLYMLSYEEGLVDSLVCPLFGEGCNTVGRSEHARHLGVPNAAVGAVGYAGMATLALWQEGGPRSWQARLLRGIAGAATAASAFLLWEQGARVRAWCFWCLTSAVINLGILGLALRDE